MSDNIKDVAGELACTLRALQDEGRRSGYLTGGMLARCTKVLEKAEAHRVGLGYCTDPPQKKRCWLPRSVSNGICNSHEQILKRSATPPEVPRPDAWVEVHVCTAADFERLERAVGHIGSALGGPAMDELHAALAAVRGE